MATSLSSQLKRLAVPYTERLLESYKPVSLLFDTAEAAGLERETFYTIGVTGLDELELLLPEFSKFRTTLFSQSSKFMERSVQTEDVNKTMDQEIRCFLQMATPFLPLKPTLKALEWLINRFNIHLYNADDLIICALPYHDTKVFARIVQLLKLETGKSRWEWLAGIQAGGIPLAKLTLYNHCISDLGFLKFVIKSAKGYVKCKELQKSNLLQAIFLFYTTTLMGVLEYSKTINEIVVTTILPYVIHGLKSDSEDYISSSYIVLACLLPKVTFSKDILESLVEVLLKNTQDKDAHKIMKCLSIVMDSQNARDINVQDCFLKRRALRSALYLLSHKHDVSSVIQVLSKGLINFAMTTVKYNKAKMNNDDILAKKKQRRRCAKIVEELISQSSLCQQDVLLIIQTLCERCVKLWKFFEKPSMRTVANLPSKIFSQLDKRYPVELDSALKTVMLTLNKTSRNIMNSLIHQSPLAEVVFNGLDDSILALYHPDSFRRELAVQTLSAASQITPMLNESLPDMMLARMEDDNPRIVQAVLNYKGFGSLKVDDFVPPVINILRKHSSNKWQAVKLSAVGALHDFLTNNSFGPDIDISTLLKPLFALLFPKTNDELMLAKKLLEKHMFSFCPVFGAIVEGLEREISFVKEIDDVNEFHASLLRSCTNDICALEQSLKLQLIKSFTYEEQQFTKGDHFSQILIPLLLSEIVMVDTVDSYYFDTAMVVCEYLANRLQDGEKLKRVKLDWNAILLVDLTAFMKAIKYSNFAVSRTCTYSTLIFGLSKIISFVKGADDAAPLKLAQSLFVKLLSGVSEACPQSHNPFQILIQLLIQKWFPAMDSWLHFLLNVLEESVNHTNDAFHLQVRILHLMSVTLNGLSAMGEQRVPSASAIKNILPWLLVMCQSLSESIRKSAVACLSGINNMELESASIKKLLKRVLKSSNEIQNDESVIKNILTRVVSAEVKKHPDIQNGILDMILNGVTEKETIGYVKDKLLEWLESVPSSVVLVRLLPLLDSILESDEAVSQYLHSVCCHIITMFSSVTADIFEISPSAEVTFFNALKCCRKPLSSNSLTIQMALLNQLTKSFFRSLNNNFQSKVINVLITLLVTGMDSEASTLCVNVLRKVLFNGEIIRNVLQDFAYEPFVTSSLKEARRKPISQGSPMSKSASSETEDEFNRKRIMVILEAIQGKKKFENCAAIIPVLFTFLKRCLGISPLNEYEMQLILDVLLHCTKQLFDAEDDPGNVFSGQSQSNIELIVQCIRTTSNSVIHHHCLLFLSSIARWFPEYVLHNSMAIFTFMGENVACQDDGYSFKVITETIINIIPQIINSQTSVEHPLEQQKLIVTIVRTFVDALPDIPEHRRIPLFTCLLTALENTEYLWLIIAVVLQSYVVWDNARDTSNEVHKNMNKQSVLDFAQNFSNCFSSRQQMLLCIRLTSHVSRLSSENKKIITEEERLYVQQLSHKQKCHYLLLCIELMSSVLSSESFLHKVIEKDVSGSEMSRKMYEPFLKSLLEIIYTFHRSANVTNSTSSFDAKFWKLILHRTYELLDKCASLVPLTIFIEVAQSLLKDPSLSIQCKAIELLTAKLQRNDEKDTQCFLFVISDLLKIIKTKEITLEIKDQSSLIMNKQLALLTFKFLIRLLAGNHPEEFREVLTIVMKLACDKQTNENLRSTSFICLAEFCHVLHAQIIPHLPNILQSIISVLDEINEISKQELLLLSTIAVIHRIVEKFAHFLSSYLHPIILKICYLSCAHSDSKKSPLLNRLSAIRQNLTREISLRLLLPAFESCFSDCSEKDVDYIRPLMVMLSDAIKNSADNVIIWQDSLLKFFLKILDFCCTLNQEMSTKIKIEESVLEPMLSLIIKMSEDSFRPFFIKLFDWATRDEDAHEQMLVFYFVVDRIADKLKSLFIPFAGHIVKNAALLLDQNNSIKADKLYFPDDEWGKRTHLVSCIVDCMHKCFLYGNEQFLNKERFDTMVDPLIDQIENIDLGDENYEEFVHNHLIPCIAQFAMAGSNDVLWKTLCYKVLLKSRHASSKIRYTSLEVIQEIAVKLGESFMTVLPETVSFLAELMEDESTDVEKLCRSVVKNMESIVGEPLQKYFSS